MVGTWPAGIGLVGAGAMGRALAVGLGRGRPEIAERLLIADVVPGAVESAVAVTGGRPATMAEACACDLVCVAVKPKDAPAALETIATVRADGGVVLSVIAGWDLDRLAAAADR